MATLKIVFLISIDSAFEFCGTPIGMPRETKAVIAKRFFSRTRRLGSELGSVHTYVTAASKQGNAVIGKKIELEHLRLYGQAIKRIWWMPRRQEAMKDVVACEKPRGACKLALIRGCPNGETHCISSILI